MVSTALVAIFVDMENVGGQFIRSVADFGATQGRVCHLAVYGDWRRGYGQHWDTTLDVGGVPTQILRTGGKNSADIAIVVDVMEFLSLTPSVQVYVLATGDSDFVPLAQKLRSRGKIVIGVAPKGRSVADTLVAACDRFERLDFDRSLSDRLASDRASGDRPAAEPASADREDSDRSGGTKPVSDRSSAEPANAQGSSALTADSRPADQAPPRSPTIEQVRALLMEMLGQRGAMTTGAIGNLLQQAMPGFRHRALGHRTLSDLLRAQNDLLEVIPTAHELRVTLLPGVRPPEGEDAEPYDAQGPARTDSDNADSDNAVPDNAVPDNAEPDNAVPDSAVPDSAVPDSSDLFSAPWAGPAPEAPDAPPADDLEEFFPALAQPAPEKPQPALASVLWPALLRHLGGVDLTAHPQARQLLSSAALQALPAEQRGESTRQLALQAGIPLPARRATWLADCAMALQQLGGEGAVLDRLEGLDAAAKKALLLALPGVGPATAEAVLSAVDPVVDRPPPQNLLLF